MQRITITAEPAIATGTTGKLVLPEVDPLLTGSSVVVGISSVIVGASTVFTGVIVVTSSVTGVSSVVSGVSLLVMVIASPVTVGVSPVLIVVSPVLAGVSLVRVGTDLVTSGVSLVVPSVAVGTSPVTGVSSVVAMDSVVSPVVTASVAFTVDWILTTKDRRLLVPSATAVISRVNLPEKSEGNSSSTTPKSAGVKIHLSLSCLPLLKLLPEGKLSTYTSRPSLSPLSGL